MTARPQVGYYLSHSDLPQQSEVCKVALGLYMSFSEPLPTCMNISAVDILLVSVKCAECTSRSPLPTQQLSSMLSKGQM